MQIFRSSPDLNAMPELRPYQDDVISRLRAAVADGQRRILLVAPTGSGKTVIISEIARSAVERGRRDTPPGMAHWAGSGPVGTTCMDCQHLDLAKDSKAEKAQCRKYKKLAHRPGKKFPKRSAACRYFEARPI